MTRYLFPAAAAVLAAIVAFGCGGVASNPTAPGFQNPNQQAPQTTPGGQQMPPGAEALLGQLSGGQPEEEIIQGTFETLWPQGLQNLESGQLQLAAQYFKSAFAQNPQSADAAIAFAITDVMRDYRRYAVFLHPGVDRLFMNTPLIGHPEAFPNPFLTEDSYFLRLAALGCRTAKNVPSVKYMTLSPVDSEVAFTPEGYERLKQMQEVRSQAVSQVPSENPPQEPQTGSGSAGEGTTDITGTGNGSGQGNGAVPSHPGLPQNPGGGQMSLPAKQNSNSKQAFSPGRTPAPGGTDTGGIPAPGLATQPPGQPPVSGLPERESPLTEDEWAVLIREYRDSAARDGADIFLSAVFYSNLSRLHDEIKEQIHNLESVRTLAEKDNYALSLSMNVLDGKQKMTFQFDVDDYHILLDHYRLIDVLLTYVESYQYKVAYALPTVPPEDKNNDMRLSPDEYLPEKPFGVLAEQPVVSLAAQLQTFIQALNGINNTMRPLLQAAQQVQAGDPEKKEIFYLSSFHRNYVLIEQWVDLLRDIADRSSSGTAIKLDSDAGMVEVVAVYDALFLTPLEDIRGPLPSFDAVTGEVILDDQDRWSSDHTFGGFFREGLEDASTYLTAGRLSCVVFDTNMARAEGKELVLGLKKGTADEKGKVVIDNAVVNELIGSPYEVRDDSGTKVGSGVLRTLCEVIPLFDPTILATSFLPPGGLLSPSGMAPVSGTQMTPPGAGGQVPVSGGASPATPVPPAQPGSTGS